MAPGQVTPDNEAEFEAKRRRLLQTDQLIKEYRSKVSRMMALLCNRNLQGLILTLEAAHWGRE